MTKRNKWPSPERFRTKTSIDAMCATKMIDLLYNSGSMRLTKVDNAYQGATYSEVFESNDPEDDSDESPIIAMRVREALGTVLPTPPEDTNINPVNYRVFVLDIGVQIEVAEPEDLLEYDDHDRYIWSPSATVIIADIANTEIYYGSELLDAYVIDIIDPETGTTLDKGELYHLHDLLDSMHEDQLNEHLDGNRLAEKVNLPFLTDNPYRASDGSLHFYRKYTTENHTVVNSCDKCPSDGNLCAHIIDTN